jgi:two-component system chemotaxis response regulator CheB
VTRRPPIDVLIVDDSPLVRQALRSIVESDPDLRARLASDPYEAVELMKQAAPDAIVLDVVMPRMDGLTFLKKLMRQHPLPVLLCTNHVERGLTGLELGALEVIPKPDWSRPEELAAWGTRLREALRRAVQGGLNAPRDSQDSGEFARVSAPSRHSADAILPRLPYVPRSRPARPIIAVGASTGGVQAIARLLRGFPADSPGMVVVQHMPDLFTAAFAARLDRDDQIALRVAEARHGDPVLPGEVLVIPGHSHGLVRRVGPGFQVELSDGPPVSRFRPSVDVLFRSAAQAAGPFACGVLLTGMLKDGAQGLLEMYEAGAMTIAQDEASCVTFSMPGEAIRLGAARQVLHLDRIAEAIRAWGIAIGL